MEMRSQGERFDARIDGKQYTLEVTDDDPHADFKWDDDVVAVTTVGPDGLTDNSGLVGTRLFTNDVEATATKGWFPSGKVELDF